MSRTGVLTVGNAIVETILAVPAGFCLGGKFTVPSTCTLGGSGIDYARRLLGGGVDAYPVLLIGDDDQGARVRRILRDDAEAGGASPSVQDFIGDPGFAAPGAGTMASTILVGEGSRTIFSHTPTEPRDFRAHLEQRSLRIASLLGESPHGILVGHVYADAVDGGCTRWLVEHYGASSKVMLNMGNSQLRHGFAVWEGCLQAVALVQLNVREVRDLFAAGGESTRSLEWMLQWFRERGIPVVITAGNCGAIAWLGNAVDALYFVKGTRLDVLDPTGAGDAFAAGLMAALCGKAEIDLEAASEALAQARAWAAYACTTLGGSGDAPNDAFLVRLSEADGEDDPVVCMSAREASDRCAALDRALA